VAVAVAVGLPTPVRAWRLRRLRAADPSPALANLPAVKANASKHKAMSYSRMKEQEEALARRVAELLANAKAADAREDAEHGPDKRGDELFWARSRCGSNHTSPRAAASTVRPCL